MIENKKVKKKKKKKKNKPWTIETYYFAVHLLNLTRTEKRNKKGKKKREKKARGKRREPFEERTVLLNDSAEATFELTRKKKKKEKMREKGKRKREKNPINLQIFL